MSNPEFETTTLVLMLFHWTADAEIEQDIYTYIYIYIYRVFTSNCVKILGNNTDVYQVI